MVARRMAADCEENLIANTVKIIKHEGVYCTAGLCHCGRSGVLVKRTPNAPADAAPEMQDHTTQFEDKAYRRRLRCLG